MKKIGITISFVAVLFFAFGFGVAKYSGSSEVENMDVDEEGYSLEDIFSDEFVEATFDVEEKRLEVVPILQGLGPTLQEPFSEKDQENLIKEIEKWKLTRVPPPDFENGPVFPKLTPNYIMDLYINTGYSFQVSSIEKSFYFDGEDGMEIYKIQNGDTFFNLLEKIERNRNASMK